MPIREPQTSHPALPREAAPSTVSRVVVALFLASFLMAQEPPKGAERFVYQGVIKEGKKKIPTSILIEISDDKVSGWIRFRSYQPIEKGSATQTSIVFAAADRTFTLERKNHTISCSGPNGHGVTRLMKIRKYRGRLHRGRIGPLEVFCIPSFAVSNQPSCFDQRPTLWRRGGPPIEEFSRVEDFLGKMISGWPGPTYVLGEPEQEELRKKP